MTHPAALMPKDACAAARPAQGRWVFEAFRICGSPVEWVPRSLWDSRQGFPGRVSWAEACERTDKDREWFVLQFVPFRSRRIFEGRALNQGRNIIRKCA